MKRLVLGILAHVDSGKTTLSESFLYHAGIIKKQGRVDHGDAFLDTDKIEKDRGITIFSKQAVIPFDGGEITLLDTPGHVDFSAEAERVLRVLDYAVLVISGSDGVQSHTRTLWNLLAHYDIPTFIFVNKMDLAASQKAFLCDELTHKLSEGCIDFAEHNDAFFENAAMLDEALLDEYMESGSIGDESLKKAIASRRLFPCFFGSALKNYGVGELLGGIEKYTLEKKYTDKFGAKIFKIGDDEKGRMLAYMKITGGSLKVKTQLEKAGKVNEIRIYSGAKYQSVGEVYAGSVCAAAGLVNVSAGEGLGSEANSESLVLEPVFSYSVKIPPDADISAVLAVFRKLEKEETQMHVIWNEHLQKIDIQVMGEVQLEVLGRILEERFGINAEFEHGSIIYKETITDRVEGVGHYEPLRHYAEVHLLLEPAPRGSGLTFGCRCSTDVLDKNWQRLVMTHLGEKTHTGVLTNSPLTDMKITLVNGRAHLKHTEGGDFRQATYRALRQGLMQAHSVLLEPYYSFTLELPTQNVGRAMTDLQQMGAAFDAPDGGEDISVISGSAPVWALQNYHASVIAYTHGQGRLSCTFKGYEPCSRQEEVIEQIGYDCEADTENTPNSVFCSHGSGFTVKWNEVFEHMHLPLLETKQKEASNMVQRGEYRKMIADEEELLRIFEMTYGKIERDNPRPMKPSVNTAKPYKAKPQPSGPVFLLIDGYNIIFAWEDLKEVARESLEDARLLLINRICNYQAVKKINVILVFDAYKVKGGEREVEKVHGISVVYTKEAETADSYIEKTTKQLCKNHRVRVATSDNLEQIIIFGHGAVRISASEFFDEVSAAENEIRRFIEENNIKKLENPQIIL